MSEESLVALMIGRPLELAFPERHDRRREREVLLAVSGSAGRAIRPDRPRRREGRDPRDRGRRGQRSGAVPSRARRCRALHRQCRLQRKRARHEIAARTRYAPESCCSAVTERGSRSFRSSASVPTRRSRCCGGSDASGSCTGARAPHGRRPRAAPPHPAGVDRAAGAVAVGRQPAEGFADAPVPPRGVNVILAEEPTQGVDVAARFDIYDALRDEGEGGRRDRSSSRAIRSSSPGSATASS